MKKTLGIILISITLLSMQGCSIDEQETLEENVLLTETVNNKNFNNNAGPIIEGCEIEYTFNDPSLSPAEKAAIRNAYGFVYSYTVVDHDTEIWVVNCASFYDYQDDNPNCDIDGCYVVTSGCPRGGCASTPPKDPDPLDHDPIEDDQ